jgi:2-desacetyl-2-hydroxyethyl bacteriochlorophyllide A dehydrogenase
MRAAVFASEGMLSIQDVPVPELQDPNDVLVRVMACGVCGTDLHILDVPQSHPATAGVILGHEFVGEITALGKDSKTLKIGQRVVIRPIVSCGSCQSCLTGNINHCSNMEIWGVYRNGGLAEFAVVPDSACIPISDQVPLELAALAEPLACVLSGVARAKVQPGENVVIIGAGAIGLLFTALLKAAGAGKIIVVEPSENRSLIATQLGANLVINPKTTNLQSEVHAFMPAGADVVIDAVGSQIEAAISISASGARIVLFGMNSKSKAEISQYVITEKELSIMGSFVGQYNFPAAVKILESGRIDLSPIISDVVGLGDLVANLAKLQSGQGVKTIVLTGHTEKAKS